MFGLTDIDMKEIIAIMQQYPEVEEAVIFGSRAKGNYKNGSDVDIALKGSTLTHDTISSISSSLNEETLMPYRFDIVNFHAIHNSDLIEHINRVGKSLYKKDMMEMELSG